MYVILNIETDRYLKIKGRLVKFESKKEADQYIVDSSNDNLKVVRKKPKRWKR